MRRHSRPTLKRKSDEPGKKMQSKDPWTANRTLPCCRRLNLNNRLSEKLKLEDKKTDGTTVKKEDTT